MTQGTYWRLLVTGRVAYEVVIDTMSASNFFVTRSNAHPESFIDAVAVVLTLVVGICGARFFGKMVWSLTASWQHLTASEINAAMRSAVNQPG